MEDVEALAVSCTRALAGHGPPRAADLLATIAPDTAVDRYGTGGVVAELEAELAAHVAVTLFDVSLRRWLDEDGERALSAVVLETARAFRSLAGNPPAAGPA